MIIKIETYKGQQIGYDDELEKFVCDAVGEQSKKVKRQTLKEIRKAIDGFIELNSKFEPFDVLFVDGYNNDSVQRWKVISLLEGGGAVLKNDVGDKWNAGYGYMKDIRKFDADLFKEYNKLNADQEELEKLFETKRKNIIAKLKPIKLKQ